MIESLQKNRIITHEPQPILPRTLMARQKYAGRGHRVHGRRTAILEKFVHPMLAKNVS